MLCSGMQKAKGIQRIYSIGRALVSIGSGHCSEELLHSEPVFLVVVRQGQMHPESLNNS